MNPICESKSRSGFVSGTAVYFLTYPRTLYIMRLSPCSSSVPGPA